MRSSSFVLELVVQLLFPFQRPCLKRNANNNINQCRLTRWWQNKTPWSLTVRLYMRRKYERFVLSFTKQMTPVAFFLHLFRDSGGAMYSWATDVARVYEKRDLTLVQATNYTRKYWTNCKLQRRHIKLILRAKSAQLTVERRPTIPKMSSFSDALRHAEGLLTLSDFGPDMISKFSVKTMKRLQRKNTSVREQAWFQRTNLVPGWRHVRKRGPTQKTVVK